MISFVSTDPKAILQEMVADFEKTLGETLFPGDERHQFLCQLAQVIVAERARINTVANRNFLRYATKEELDEYGYQFDEVRRPATTASVEVQFTVSSAQAYDLGIPAGTRVSPDGRLMFLLPQSAVIPEGVEGVTVTMVAEQPGAAYNGFLPGQIATLVDPIPYIASVTNTTISIGGTDAETDDDYRERIRQSYAVTSTAGAVESYAYFARFASPEVVDVRISNPADLEVRVCVLGPNATASATLLKTVETALTGSKVRPLSDYVTVVGPTQVTYNISLTYYIAQDAHTQETSIRNAVEQAVQAFVLDNQTHLGGAVNPDTLRKSILNVGAYRVDISSPLYTSLQEQEVAVAGTIAVEYGGRLG